MTSRTKSSSPSSKADSDADDVARGSDFDRHESAARLLEQTERILAEVRGLGLAVKEEAGSAVGSAKQSGAEALDRGKERARDARDGIEQYVERQPLRALLIAAGVGLVLGFWSRR